MLVNARPDKRQVKLHVVNNSNVDDKKLLKDKCLLAFEKNGPELSGKARNRVYELSFDDATRNVLVLGATGQGKTESILKPAADKLISSGCAGLILDAKNDYAFLEGLYPDQVLRLSLHGHEKINLIGGIEPSVFRAILENLRKAYSSKEAYWGMSGVEDALLVFIFYRCIGKSPTLADVYNGLANPKSFCEQLERYLLTASSITVELSRQLEYRLSDTFSILWVGEFQDNESESSRATEQYAWQTNAIKKVLSPFENNPALKQVFCAEHSIDFQGLIYSQGKTLILDINPDLLPDSSQTIGQIIRLMFMHSVTSSSPSQRKSQGYGEHRFTFMLIDEYQQFIYTESRENSSSLRDDNTWLDRSRAYGHINILATQSINSLLSRADETAAKTIIQNCQTTICLPTTDSITLSRITELAGYQNRANEATYTLLHSKMIGSGFIHIANHASSGHGVICGMFSAGRLTNPQYHFMSRYIDSHHTYPARPTSDCEQSRLIDNKYRKCLEEISFLTGNIILVSTNENCDLKELTQEISSIEAVTTVEHKIINSDSQLSQDDAEYFELILKGDIIIFTSLPESYPAARYIAGVNIPSIFNKAEDEGAITLTCCIDDSAIGYMRDADMNFSTKHELLDKLKFLFSSKKSNSV